MTEDIKNRVIAFYKTLPPSELSEKALTTEINGSDEERYLAIKELEARAYAKPFCNVTSDMIKELCKLDKVYYKSEDYVALNEVLCIIKQYEKTGLWIGHTIDDYGYHTAECSICGAINHWEENNEDGDPSYCNICGTKITGFRKGYANE